MNENKKQLSKKTKRNYKILALIDAAFIIMHLAISFFLIIISSGPYGPLEFAIGIMALDLVLMIIYGIVSYLSCHSVIYPSLIIAGFSLASLLIAYLITVWCYPFDILAIQLNMWCCYSVIASFISSIVTMLLSKLCKFIKNKRNIEEQSPTE